MPAFQRIHEMIRKSEKAKREVLENREKRTYNAQKSSAEKSTLKALRVLLHTNKKQTKKSLKRIVT